MGNKTSTGPRPRLVIVGGSWAAVETYKALHKEFDIKIIDSKDFIEVTPAMHYYYTGQIPHEKISLPFEDSILRGTHIHGKAIELQANAVAVQTADGLKTIEFDYCLVATGALYPSDMKPNFELKTLHEYRIKIKAVQDKVLNAKKVLVRGAGVVGVEVATELAAIGKQVVLACRGGKILPKFPPKAQRRAQPCIDEVGVKIVDTNQSVPSAEDFDLVYDCTGNTYPIEDNILNKNFLNYRDDKGRVRVNDFFQICDEKFNPIHNIFAVGDCCITQANEEKNINNLRNGVKIAAHNLKELAHKGKDGRLKFKRFPKERSKLPLMALVSLGRRSLLVMGSKTMRGEFLTKMKKSIGPKIIKELTLKERKRSKSQ